MARHSTALEQLRKRIETWKSQDFAVHFNSHNEKIIAPVEELGAVLLDEKEVALLLEQVFCMQPLPINEKEVFKFLNVESFDQIKNLSSVKCDEIAQHFMKKAIETAYQIAPWEQRGPLEMVKALGELLDLCVHSTKKMAACFGYDLDSEQEKNFLYQIFKSGVSFLNEEKTISQTTAEDPLIAIPMEVSGIVKNLIRRRAAICLPSVDADWAGSVNVGLIKDVCEMAIHFYCSKKLETEKARVVKLESKKTVKTVSPEHPMAASANDDDNKKAA